MTERELEEIRRYVLRQVEAPANRKLFYRLLEELAASERKLEEARRALDKMRKACREEEMQYFEDIALIADAVLGGGPET